MGPSQSRGSPLPEQRLHYLFGDWSGDRAAEPVQLVLHDHGDCHTWCVGGGESREPGRVDVAAAYFRGAGLARHTNPGNGGSRSRPAGHDELHHPGQLVSGLALDRPTELIGLEVRDRLPAGSDDPFDDLGTHLGAVVADRRRHHRHLQRSHRQSLLAERTAAGIDLRVRVLGIEESSVVVQAALDALALRQLEWRQRVEAEALRVVEDGARAEGLADVAKDRVDRVLEAGRQVDVADRLRRLWIAGVADVLAVLLAVAGIVKR